MSGTSLGRKGPNDAECFWARGRRLSADRCQVDARSSLSAGMASTPVQPRVAGSAHSPPGPFSSPCARSFIESSAMTY